MNVLENCVIAQTKVLKRSKLKAKEIAISYLRQVGMSDFIYSDTRITIDALLVEQVSGQQLVVIRFENPTPGIWTIGIQKEPEIAPAACDIWLPIQQFMTGSTYFLEPTSYITLTMPATASTTLCVAAYNTDTGGLFQESGRGFTRSEVIKPDLAAPGVNVAE